MRKFITKEIKKTTIEVVDIQIVDGAPVSKAVDPIKVMGAITMERANAKARNLYRGQMVAVIGLKEEVTVYQMPIEQFLELATIKEKEDEIEEVSAVTL
jgi:hypothetical protein